MTIQSGMATSNNGNLVCTVPSSRWPDNIDALGPQNWPNGTEQTMSIFIVDVDGVNWTTIGLANKVTVTFDEATDQLVGGLWFVAADQTPGRLGQCVRRGHRGPFGGLCRQGI